jgi:hypothetical protein
MFLARRTDAVRRSPPFTGAPGDVVERICSWVAPLVNDRRVVLFSFGRTINLERRRVALRVDYLLPVYATSSAENAMQIERTLIHLFQRHRKIRNVAASSSGRVGVSRSHYVYVATSVLSG